MVPTRNKDEPTVTVAHTIPVAAVSKEVRFLRACAQNSQRTCIRKDSQEKSGVLPWGGHIVGTNVYWSLYWVPRICGNYRTSAVSRADPFLRVLAWRISR